MKQTVVPAQVTTVEDRIAGNLSLSQIMLLIAPVFIGTAIYFILPPLGKPTIYKFALLSLLVFVAASLSIRIRGKIVLFWLITLAKYNSRPRYFVFNKQTTYARELTDTVKATELVLEAEDKPERVRKQLSLSPADMMNISNILDNPASNLHFENRKGSLYVRITEVQQES
jgi:hypothetical protein